MLMLMQKQKQPQKHLTQSYGDGARYEAKCKCIALYSEHLDISVYFC
jgi:hypothetical protein